MTIKEYIDNRNKINSLEEDNLKFIKQFDDTIEFIVKTYNRFSTTYKWFYDHDRMFIRNSEDSFDINLKRYYGDDPEPDEHNLNIPIKFLTASTKEIEDFLKEFVEKEENEIKKRKDEYNRVLIEKRKKLEELHNTEEYKKYMDLKKKFGE